MRLMIYDRQMNVLVDVFEAHSNYWILWCLEFAINNYRNSGYIWKVIAV